MGFQREQGRLNGADQYSLSRLTLRMGIFDCLILIATVDWQQAEALGWKKVFLLQALGLGPGP